MKVYEVIKKPQLDIFGRYEEKYLLKTKIFGIPFYTVGGDDSIIGIIGAIILGMGTLALPFLFFALPFLNFIYLTLLTPFLWYGWHFTNIRRFDSENTVKKIVEAKISKSLNKNNDVVIRYIQNGNNVEVDRFLN